LTGNALALNPTTNNVSTIGLSNTGTNVITLGTSGLTLGAAQTFSSASGTLVLSGTTAGATAVISEGANALTVTGAGAITVLQGVTANAIQGSVAGGSNALIKGA